MIAEVWTDVEIPLTRPCTINSMAENGTNDYGDAEYTATEVETVCELQQRAAAENAEDVSDTLWDLFLPGGTELSNIDSISIDGAGDFEVLGDPWGARDPELGSEHHVEVIVRQTD